MPDFTIKIHKLKRCSVAECHTRGNKTKIYKGMFCIMHYARTLQKGSPYAWSINNPYPYTIIGDTGYIMVKNPDGSHQAILIVDRDMTEKAASIKWSICSRGHARYQPKSIYLHHFVYGKKIMLDHINRNPRDNRINNLRETDAQLNHGNMRRESKNTSGYKGVVRGGKKWTAQIRVNYQIMNLGTYEFKEEAAVAYDVAAIQAFGDHALLNIIK